MEIIYLVIGISFFLFFLNRSKVEKKEPESFFFREKLKQLRDRKKTLLLERSERFFEHLFDYSLTNEQVDAVINDSKNCMVIASAGSGKTSTIVAKFGYLIQTKDITESEILVLAFNNKVSKEIKQKIDSHFDVDSHVHTFHSLGKEIITELTEEKKALDDLAREDLEGIMTTANIEKIISEAITNYPEIRNWIADFRILCPYHKIETFAKDLKQYKQAINAYPYKREMHQIGEKRRPLSIPTINGKYFVKSQEELAIANHLILNGIAFNYEKAFPIQTEDSDFGVYTPDFYYPEVDLWHEHFALDRNGNPPQSFEGYKEEAEWKKEFHREHGTRIIYTYSYQFNEDIIFDQLDDQLKKYGLAYSPIDQEEINNLIGEIFIDDTYKLIKTCIKLAKTKNLSSDEISSMFNELQDQFRSNRFKRFFIPLLDTYQGILRKNNTIDFEDMIIDSAKLLKTIKAEPNKSSYGNFRYIFVDEFQDISESRSIFLNNLRGNAKLFCVGDDWQSIYRFTGSDNTIIKSFKNIYHTLLNFNISTEYNQKKQTIQMSTKKIETESDQEKISQLFIDDATEKNGTNFSLLQDEPNASFVIQSNFRTGDAINIAASDFIQKNPFQITKEVRSNNVLTKEQKERAINFCEIGGYDNSSIERILRTVPIDGKNRDVFILGRKNSDFAEIKPGPLMDSRPDLSIKKSTIHKAKGLESDIVILLGLEGGIKGFPNKTGDDPLISTFLPKEDSFIDSEERRVMYVAMTRAKEMIFFVNRLHDRSEFVDEVMETCNELDIRFNEDIFNQGIKPCPECKKKGNQGFMQLLKNRENKSIFLGCNFFFSLDDEVQCRYTENVVPCMKCKSRGNDSKLKVMENNLEHLIVCESCDFTEDFENL